jgi:predicted RNase H-like nuclease (RuvC/YqgF family)
MMIEQDRDDSMQETVDSISQLETATASDRGTVATLTTTNAKLANHLEAAHALIAQLKNEITTLKNKIKPAWQGQRPVKTTNNDSYCWLHGYQVTKSHTSARCNIKRADTKIQQRRTTPWVECNGAKNDTEGQLRLEMIN